MFFFKLTHTNANKLTWCARRHVKGDSSLITVWPVYVDLHTWCVSAQGQKILKTVLTSLFSHNFALCSLQSLSPLTLQMALIAFKVLNWEFLFCECKAKLHNWPQTPGTILYIWRMSADKKASVSCRHFSFAFLRLKSTLLFVLDSYSYSVSLSLSLACTKERPQAGPGWPSEARKFLLYHSFNYLNA